MARAYVSIGSNVEPGRHVRAALEALAERFGPLVVSPVYEGPAVGFSGANFLNLVVGFETGEPPARVVQALKGIEAAHGRIRAGPRFADRTLDLDLILYGNQVIRAEGVSVPRDEVIAHAHVLRPLADIAGAEVHPVLGRSYRDLWQELGDGDERLWPARLDGGSPG